MQDEGSAKGSWWLRADNENTAHPVLSLEGGNPGQYEGMRGDASIVIAIVDQQQQRQSILCLTLGNPSDVQALTVSALETDTLEPVAKRDRPTVRFFNTTHGYWHA